MLTVPPGPDIVPYHNRGVALLSRRNGALGSTARRRASKCSARQSKGA